MYGPRGRARRGEATLVHEHTMRIGYGEHSVLVSYFYACFCFNNTAVKQHQSQWALICLMAPTAAPEIRLHKRRECGAKGETRRESWSERARDRVREQRRQHPAVPFLDSTKPAATMTLACTSGALVTDCATN